MCMHYYIITHPYQLFVFYSFYWYQALPCSRLVQCKCVLKCLFQECVDVSHVFPSTWFTRGRSGRRRLRSASWVRCLGNACHVPPRTWIPGRQRTVCLQQWIAVLVYKFFCTLSTNIYVIRGKITNVEINNINVQYRRCKPLGVGCRTNRIVRLTPTSICVVRTEAHIPRAVEEPTVLVPAQRLLAVTCRLTSLLGLNDWKRGLLC